MSSLVSIIIPIYNVSEYMDASIRSACDQDYQNLEIILVDDGSTDNSGNKCDIWSKRDSRIRVIHKKNGGLSSARNAGLDVAKGIYIYFLDGDDTIENNLVSTIIQYMEQGEDIIFFRHYVVTSDGKKIPINREAGRYNLDTDEKRAHFLTDYILSGRLNWEAWNKFYRRDLIDRYNLRFADNNIIFAEDLYFCLCYCSHAIKVLSVDEFLYNYIQRSDSIMAEQALKLNINRMNELAKHFLMFLQQSSDCSAIIKRFSVIYFMIIDNVLTRARNTLTVSSFKFRKMVYADVNDSLFMKTWIRKFLKIKQELYSIYLGSTAALKISFIKFLYDGNYLTFRLRNQIVIHFREYFDSKNPQEKAIKSVIQKYSKNQKCIYYIGSEEFGNLGDHQIAEAIKKFCDYYFADYHFMEFTIREFPKVKLYLKKYIKKQDLIFLTGGGNLGDAYPEAENLRQDIISTWVKNVKVVFPQTIDFSENSKASEDFKNAQRIYSKENNVILFTREKRSYQFAQEFFYCETYLTPDIVLFCNEQKKEKREKVVLFCFRSDKEQFIDELTKKKIEREANRIGYEINKTDLQLPYNVPKAKRKEKIEGKLEEMRHASLVVTDRLHGMIFAVITGTPCIAFNNYNYKVKGTYDWISYLPYIKFAENAEEAIEVLPELLNLKDTRYNNLPLLKYYDQLAQVVKEKCLC